MMAPAPACARFRFYAELNDHLPFCEQYGTVEKQFFVPASVKDMIEGIGVPHTEVDLVLVNGESSDFTRLIRNGDRVAVYPVFESIDITPVLRLRPQPLRETRFASSAESVGRFRFGQSSKCVIEGHFHRFEGAEAEGSSGNHTDFVVEAFDRAAGKFPFGPEPVEQPFLMIAQHTGNLLHGFEAAAQGAFAPGIQKARPEG